MATTRKVAQKPVKRATKNTVKTTAKPAVKKTTAPKRQVAVVAIGGNSIGSYDDLVNLSLTHEKACHIIRNQSEGDFFFFQFPGSKPCSL